MATDVVKQIRRRTRRKFSADEKIRIVLIGTSGRSPDHRAVSTTRHSALDLLQMVESLSGCW